MPIPSVARRTLIASLSVLAFVLILGADASSSSAASEIEGVWSFDDGAVDITAQANGTFIGTVSVETTFNACPHEVGETMWTGITEQPDGSFWGLHQWFVKNEETGMCEDDPRGLGPTAWRVLHNSGGERYLKVCFSHPASSQPKISPEGAATDTTYGCYESKPLGTVPTTTTGGSTGTSNGSGTLSFSSTVSLPTACTASKRLKIRLKDPKYDPLEKVVIKLNGKKALTVKGVKRLRRAITLTKLPSGKFKLTVTATTVLNQRLRGSRTYSGCGSKPEHVKLHKPKHHA
jgi:hypothetical protein